MRTIRVAEFSHSPGGRFKVHGPSSGEEYREEVLVPALKDAISADETLTVELDGTSGYGSSFLEEAFGGLIRKGGIAPTLVRRHLAVTANTPLYAPYATLAKRYIDAAERNLMAA